jgi:hypothetical protein
VPEVEREPGQRAFMLWRPEDVRIIKGAELVGTFNKTDDSRS